MYTIRVSDGVDKVIAKWKKSNPNLFKKYKKIYKELLEHPKTGLGHPEALRGGGDVSGVFLFCLLSCPFSIAVKCYILLQFLNTYLYLEYYDVL